LVKEFQAQAQLVLLRLDTQAAWPFYDTGGLGLKPQAASLTGPKLWDIIRFRKE
jgi:hypothetical protein